MDGRRLHKVETDAKKCTTENNSIKLTTHVRRDWDCGCLLFLHHQSLKSVY